MSTDLQTFLERLENDPQSITFEDTMAVIDANYTHQPTAFTNGDIENAAGENSGSCKLFAFAALNELSEARTLACFGDYYRKDVLGNFAGTDHQNIRTFMRKGWIGIDFDIEPLIEKE